jgi:exopolysaccharide production protein ExoY
MTIHYDPQKPSAPAIPAFLSSPHAGGVDSHASNHVRRSDFVRTIPTAGLYRVALKRVLDILAVLAALPIVVPVIAGLAFVLALDGGNPFYFQSRVGRNGRHYRMWKLRSMVVGADAALEKHLASNPAARIEWNRDQKLKNDPRITRVGRFLRKASIDELPQLWNVLIGDMSLVGPRPMMPCQKELYPGKAYYRLRPGITGPWQVSRRNESTFADRARFDTDYEHDLSFRTDMGLLLATVRVVVRATGY